MIYQILPDFVDEIPEEIDEGHRQHIAQNGNHQAGPVGKIHAHRHDDGAPQLD